MLSVSQECKEPASLWQTLVAHNSSTGRRLTLLLLLCPVAVLPCPACLRSRSLVKRVTDVCFNEDLKPQDPLPNVPTVIVITLDELSDGGVRPCPSTPQEVDKIQTDLEGVLNGLVQLSGGILGGYSVTVNADACVEVSVRWSGLQACVSVCICIRFLGSGTAVVSAGRGV